MHDPREDAPSSWRRFRSVFGKPSVEREVSDELAFHLEMRTRDLIARGLSPTTARAEAERRFGNLAQVSRTCTDIGKRRDQTMRRAETFQELRSDVRYAVRSLRKRPGFTAVVALTLALGIGANTAIFSVVKAVLLAPLPFREPERLVRIWSANPGAQKFEATVSWPDVEDWRRLSTSFEKLATYSTLPGGVVLAGGDGQEPLRLTTCFIGADLFATLGVRPILGRLPAPDEFRDGTNQVVVLGEGFWRARFGGDPAIVGRAVTLDDRPYTVLGVLPDLRWPVPDVQAWVPLTVIPETGIPRARGVHWLSVVGRLKPGVTPRQANADLSRIAARIAQDDAKVSAGWTETRMKPLHEAIVGDVRTGLLVLFGAVTLVVLIACANVANLMLARASSRARELAVRSALGASRGRIVRQLLTESVVLALLGGALGTLLAWRGVRLLVALAGNTLPRAADVRVDGWVLAFVALLSILTGLGFGILPALKATRPNIGGMLRDSVRATAGAGVNRLRASFIVAEVTLAVLLAVGAGLMVRSFERLLHVDPGFQTGNVVAVRLSLPDRVSESGTQLEVFSRMLDAVREVPGVVSAATAKGLPLRGEMGLGEPYPYHVPGEPPAVPGEAPTALVTPVTPGWFRTLGIPLLAGRDIEPQDGDTAMVAVINEAMAKRHYPKGAVGEMVDFLGEYPMRIVGVVRDVRYARLDSVPGPTMYVPRRIMRRSVAAMVIRTTGDPASAIPAIRRAIRSVQPDQAFTEVVTMRQVVSDAAARQRFLTTLITLFGAIALTLAAVGLYGVVSYVVTQRTNEIGIRMALGARQRDVIGLMLRRGMTPVVIGLALGLAGAFALSRVLGSLLYEVSARDPMTFGTVLVVLAATSLVAAWLPARRAASVDPTRALRYE